MRRVATALSFAVAVLGAIGVASPDTLLAVARRLASPADLFVAAAVRVGFGGVLILAAPASRTPRAVRVIGAFILVAGIITPFLGVERARAILDWWSAQGALFAHATPAIALAVGCGLIHLFSPRRSAP